MESLFKNISKDELLKMTAEQLVILMGRGNIKCEDMIECFYCIGCKQCDNCADCVGCGQCVQCSRCVDCIGCFGCAECESCTNCVMCIRQKGAQYMVMDIQLTKEEYKSIGDKLNSKAPANKSTKGMN